MNLFLKLTLILKALRCQHLGVIIIITVIRWHNIQQLPANILLLEPTLLQERELGLPEHLLDIRKLLLSLVSSVHLHQLAPGGEVAEAEDSSWLEEAHAVSLDEVQMMSMPLPISEGVGVIQDPVKILPGKNGADCLSQSVQGNHRGWLIITPGFKISKHLLVALDYPVLLHSALLYLRGCDGQAKTQLQHSSSFTCSCPRQEMHVRCLPSLHHRLPCYLKLVVVADLDREVGLGISPGVLAILILGKYCLVRHPGQ